MRHQSKARLFSTAIVVIFAAIACERQAATPEPHAATPVEAPASDPQDGMDRLLMDMVQEHAQSVIADSPELASALGLSADIAGEGFNSRFGAYGFEASQRARQLNETFFQEIRSIERKDLSAEAAITYDVLRAVYATAAQRNQFAFGSATPWGSAGPYPITQLSGPHLALPRLLQSQHALNSRSDAEGYIARLNEFGRVFNEVMETVSSDAATGAIPPEFAITGAVASMRSFIAPRPENNPLYTTFDTRLSEIEGLTQGDRDVLLEDALTAINDVVYPAYEELAASFEAMTPQAGSDAGIWRIGDEGARFYQHALDAYGASGKAGEEIHTLGLEEVARITEEMDGILKSQGLVEGSVAERFAAIGRRPEMRYPNTDEGRAVLLADLNAQVADIMAAAPKWFGVMPDNPVEVRRIPIFEQDSAPGGYYTSPPIDGSRPGIFWINLKNTADWPKHTLKTLTYHEAAPGHHFQRALERSMDLPLIRNMLGNSEFSEGWALYAEQVAAEMGMYADDPLGDLGRLQSELFRAARLVVDTGLHAKRWSREEAIDYMQGVTGDTRDSITREVERYAVWPGQATSYKLGMIKMNELRSRAEASLGDEFDIRAFHDEVLTSGSMPLPVLERKIDGWITEQSPQ